MEVLFKDDIKFFHITDNRLSIKYIIKNSNINLSNIKHLDDIKPLYHYRDRFGKLFPVYYEYGRRFITEYDNMEYDVTYVCNGDIKDYTLINLNLL